MEVPLVFLEDAHAEDGDKPANEGGDDNADDDAHTAAADCR